MNITLQNSLFREYGTTEINKIFGKIYDRHFNMVKVFVLQNNGSLTDAEDIFQETLIILNAKLNEEDFMLTAQLKTYIMGISKNLWYKRLRDQKIIVDIGDYENTELQEMDWFVENEKSNSEKILNVLAGISTHCNRLINDIFFKSTPIREIQKLYGYSSKHNAQNQKHKCIQQMRKEKVKIYG